MSTYYTNSYAADEAIDATNLNQRRGALDQAIYDNANGVSANPLLLATALRFSAGTELTISSGAVTRTQAVHTIDTESDAASDDLTDINGGSIGDILIISANNTARTVVVKHNVSKIALADGADISLDETWKTVTLYKIGASLWIELRSPTPAGGSAPSYVKVSDVKAKNTNGGGSSAGWQIRTLNTEDSDPDSICSLASNQITLAAGTYECDISAPANAASLTKIVLYNATDSSVVLHGENAFCTTSDNVTVRARLRGRFTIGASKALEVRHYTASAVATTGLGVAMNINDPTGASQSEVYTVAEFWKVG